MEHHGENVAFATVSEYDFLAWCYASLRVDALTHPMVSVLCERLDREAKYAPPKCWWCGDEDTRLIKDGYGTERYVCRRHGAPRRPRPTQHSGGRQGGDDG